MNFKSEADKTYRFENTKIDDRDQNFRSVQNTIECEDSKKVEGTNP